jgi:hypothetical protein
VAKLQAIRVDGLELSRRLSQLWLQAMTSRSCRRPPCKPEAENSRTQIIRFLVDARADLEVWWNHAAKSNGHGVLM